MIYFDKPGRGNTETTLKIALEEAGKRGIGYVVLASTAGNTARIALRLNKDSDIKLIVVTHNTGFSSPGQQEFSEEIKKEVEDAGGMVYTGTMVLRGVGRAIRDRMNHSQEEMVAGTLRMFGQGTKVCVEMVAMLADAGLIPITDVIAVAGTAKGADTALVIAPNPSNKFFDIKVREVLAKPREF